METLWRPSQLDTKKRLQRLWINLYKRLFCNHLNWWAQQDSNLRPTDYESINGHRCNFKAVNNLDIKHCIYIVYMCFLIIANDFK